MHHPQSNPEPVSEELTDRLVALGKKIATLPEEHFRELEGAYSQVVDCVQRRQRILKLVQESLAHLRLDVKYLMFDLEITREERDTLQAQVDSQNSDDWDNGWS